MIENADCCVIENDSIVQRSELGKTFVIRNRERRRIKVCRVDGCLIGQDVKKCDFLFVLDHDNCACMALVELKGVDHCVAVEQIVTAAEKLDLKRYGVELRSYIVGASAPKITSAYQKAVLKHSQRYKKAGVATPIKKNIKLVVDWPDRG